MGSKEFVDDVDDACRDVGRAVGHVVEAPIVSVKLDLIICVYAMRKLHRWNHRHVLLGSGCHPGVRADYGRVCGIVGLHHLFETRLQWNGSIPVCRFADYNFCKLIAIAVGVRFRNLQSVDRHCHLGCCDNSLLCLYHLRYVFAVSRAVPGRIHHRSD